MDQLNNDDTGRYAITTASGTVYLVDLDRHELTRRPSTDAVDTDGFESASMRRDGDVLELITIVFCEVGHSAIFGVGKVAAYAGYIATARQTTPVLSITPLDKPALPLALMTTPLSLDAA